MGENVEFRSNGGTAHGYLALPASGAGRGVVVIQEWWGLVPHIQDVCDRLAAEGFVALAPDLYHGQSTTEPDEAGKQMMALDLPRATAEMTGAAAYLHGRDDTHGRSGVIGFCMGGALALLAATQSEHIAACSAFYPAFAWPELAPAWGATAGKHVQMHLAEGDGGSGVEPVQAARTAIDAAGGHVELFDYAGTQHAFFNDSRPEVYDPTAADQAWRRTLDLLRSQL